VWRSHRECGQSLLEVALLFIHALLRFLQLADVALKLLDRAPELVLHAGVRLLQLLHLFDKE
jgi:hypothetical protein